MARSAFAHLVDLLVPPTDVPGRRRSYHRVIYLVVAALLMAVLLAPLRVAVPVAVAVFLAWWFAESPLR
jgi:hypothetical protein